MRRVLALCAVAGIATSVFAVPASAAGRLLRDPLGQHRHLPGLERGPEVQAVPVGRVDLQGRQQAAPDLHAGPISRSSCARSAAARSELDRRRIRFRGRVARAARPLPLQGRGFSGRNRISRAHALNLISTTELLTSCPGRRPKSAPHHPSPSLSGGASHLSFEELIMRRISVLCAAAGLAVTAFVAASPAEASYHLVRWQDTGLCQIWDESIPTTPWPAGYASRQRDRADLPRRTRAEGSRVEDRSLHLVRFRSADERAGKDATRPCPLFVCHAHSGSARRSDSALSRVLCAPG